MKQGLLESSAVAKLAAALLIVLVVFVGAKALQALFDLDTAPAPAANAITVSGTGTVSASPDVATLSFTVSEEGSTASQAQDAATKKSNVAIAVVRELGIPDEDIKTTSYNLSPRYAYQPPCYTSYCPPTEVRISGYTVSQTVEVKVRDLDKVSNTLSALGDAGVSGLYGPNFTIDEEEALRAEARKAAIDDARAKAKALARDLGVRVVRIVAFSENGVAYPYYDKAYGMGGALEAAPARPSPDVPAGENEIVVNVSVTYEIR